MFGMLDYRANKLFRLLTFPLRIVVPLVNFVIIAIAIIIALATSFGVFAKIGIAYVAFEVIWALFSGVLNFMSWILRRTFFWLIDVVPAHGANHDEARAIALSGRIAELRIKYHRDIANWTPEDTDEIVLLLNWRARLFFGGKNRIRMQRGIAELKRIYQETGRQPAELGLVGIKEICERVPGVDIPWFEQAIVSQRYFNCITAIALIVLVIGYTSAHGS